MNVTVTVTVVEHLKLSEAINELYLLVAYVAIGLLSITVPTFALGVAFVGREKSRISNDMEQIQGRRKTLQATVERALVSSDERLVRSALDTVEEYEEQARKLARRLITLESLSAKRCVGYPSISFLGTIIAVAVFSYYTGDSQLAAGLFVASLCLACGMFYLARSLVAIEQVATRARESVLPLLRVSFERGIKAMQFKTREKREVMISVWNDEDVNAEDVSVALMFSAEFKVLPSEAYAVVKTEPSEFFLYPNSVSAQARFDRVYARSSEEFRVLLEMPEKPGTYLVPVEMREKEIGRVYSELRIEISD